MCTRCKATKELTEFSPNGKNSVSSRCKPCKSDVLMERYWKDKESFSKKSKQYYAKNKEEIKSNVRSWYRNNRDRALAAGKIRSKLYSERFRHKLTEREARRRFLKNQATPKWLTKSQIEEMAQIYKRAKELEKLDGIKRHVDHIIPLKNDIICGLHVPWNLQILTQSENCSKRNKLEF
jgi:hypothetical protein